MVQKILRITGVISVILISALFFFLVTVVSGKLKAGQRRTEQFIVSTAANGVRTIRNEILYLFEHYSDRIDELNRNDWDGDLKSLDLKEEYQLEDFPSIVRHWEYLESASKTSRLAENTPERIESFEEGRIPGEGVGLINIKNLSGYMGFPVTARGEGALTGYLVVHLDLRPAVEEYLPERLLEELQSSGEKSREYSVILKEGHDMEDEKGDGRIVIDLNRDFNLFNIRDYYYTRPDSFMPVPSVEKVTGNHRYLIVSHSETDKGVFLKIKIRTYGLLALCYFFLVGVVLTFLYSVYRIRREYYREQQFTSLISHELKTPLSVIRLASESLADGYITQGREVAEYGAMIKEETGRLGRMIENILLVSTLSWAGKGKEQIGVEELLCDLREQNLSLLKSREVHWQTENFLGNRTVQTHLALLKAALQNVIHNGIVYGASRSKERILIVRAEGASRKKGEGVLFSVIDRGPGIGWSESQKIFENYYRGRDVSQEQLPGSGMGLALSRRIAEGLGGTLTINRSLKKETAFEFWIPLRKRDEENTDY
ncbi:MAG: HAMP domain-containing sensor histidine kinase [Spirochaetales bacterium]|nr:HAMP domain-containing sensor histidine kinase [Spirochaetales bacterium]